MLFIFSMSVPVSVYHNIYCCCEVSNEVIKVKSVKFALEQCTKA